MRLRNREYSPEELEEFRSQSSDEERQNGNATLNAYAVDDEQGYAANNDDEFEYYREEETAHEAAKAQPQARSQNDRKVLENQEKNDNSHLSQTVANDLNALALDVQLPNEQQMIYSLKNSVKRALQKQIKQNALIIIFNLMGCFLIYHFFDSFIDLHSYQPLPSAKDLANELFGGLTQERTVVLYGDKQNLLPIAQIIDLYLGANFLTLTDLLAIVFAFFLQLRLFGKHMTPSKTKNFFVIMLLLKDFYNIALILSSVDFARFSQSQTLLEFEIVVSGSFAAPAFIFTLHKLIAFRFFYFQKALRPAQNCIAAQASTEALSAVKRGSASGRKPAARSKKNSRNAKTDDDCCFCCSFICYRLSKFFYPHDPTLALDIHYRNRAFVILLPFLVAIPQIAVGVIFGNVVYLAWSLILVTLLYFLRLLAKGVFWLCAKVGKSKQGKNDTESVAKQRPQQKKPLDVENWIVILLLSNSLGLLIWIGFNVGDIMRFFFSGGMVYCNFLRTANATNIIQQKQQLMHLLSIF